jgi:hypothetical protein
MSTGNKSLIVSTSDNQGGHKIYRLSPSDPINGPKTSVDKSYETGTIYVVPGTRTIIAREYITDTAQKVHLIDSLTLQDYGAIDVPAYFAQSFGVAAFVDSDGSVKVFMTNVGNKVFVFSTHQL